MMNMKSKLKEIRDNYVINQVERQKLPEFTESRICRYRVLFSGRVQKIGFRLEVCKMAERLGLTGFCQNLENGDVLAELQGKESKIQYLLVFMDSLKRIKIREKTIEEVAVNSEDAEFLRL